MVCSSEQCNDLNHGGTFSRRSGSLLAPPASCAHTATGEQLAIESPVAALRALRVLRRPQERGRSLRGAASFAVCALRRIQREAERLYAASWASAAPHLSSSRALKRPTTLPFWSTRKKAAKFHCTGPGKATLQKFHTGSAPLTSVLAISVQPSPSTGRSDFCTKAGICSVGSSCPPNSSDG